MSLCEEIKELLCYYPKGIKASEIAKKLGKTRHSINKCLYSNRTIFSIDDKYCWTVINPNIVKDMSPSAFPIINEEEIEDINSVLSDYDL